MFPADVSAILQNSLTPITAWVLDELNQCEIFLPWFFQLKLRVKAHWLSLPSGKYSDLWSEASNYSVLSQKPHVSVQLFMGLLFILKDIFLFPGELEWLCQLQNARWTGGLDSNNTRRSVGCWERHKPCPEIFCPQSLLFHSVWDTYSLFQVNIRSFYKEDGEDWIGVHVNHYHLLIAFRLSRCPNLKEIRKRQRVGKGREDT